MIDLSWNWISSRLEWIRSSRSVEDKCCSKSSILECGRPVPRPTSAETRGLCRELLRRSRRHFIKRSSGGVCRNRGRQPLLPQKRQKNQKRAANKTRCESHLLFSRPIVVCVYLHVRAGTSAGPRSGRMCECRRAEAPRHLGCETGDMPWKNPMDPLLVLLLVLLCATRSTLARPSHGSKEFTSNPGL